MSSFPSLAEAAIEAGPSQRPSAAAHSTGFASHGPVVAECAAADLRVGRRAGWWPGHDRCHGAGTQRPGYAWRFARGESAMARTARSFLIPLALAGALAAAGPLPAQDAASPGSEATAGYRLPGAALRAIVDAPSAPRLS